MRIKNSGHNETLFRARSNVRIAGAMRVALCFPRIKALRRDKTPAEIDTLRAARKLAG